MACEENLREGPSQLVRWRCQMLSGDDGLRDDAEKPRQKSRRWRQMLHRKRSTSKSQAVEEEAASEEEPSHLVSWHCQTLSSENQTVDGDLHADSKQRQKWRQFWRQWRYQTSSHDYWSADGELVRAQQPKQKRTRLWSLLSRRRPKSSCEIAQDDGGDGGDVVRDELQTRPQRRRCWVWSPQLETIFEEPDLEQESAERQSVDAALDDQWQAGQQSRQFCSPSGPESPKSSCLDHDVEAEPNQKGSRSFLWRRSREESSCPNQSADVEQLDETQVSAGNVQAFPKLTCPNQNVADELHPDIQPTQNHSQSSCSNKSCDQETDFEETKQKAGWPQSQFWRRRRPKSNSQSQGVAAELHFERQPTLKTGRSSDVIQIGGQEMGFEERRGQKTQKDAAKSQLRSLRRSKSSFQIASVGVETRVEGLRRRRPGSSCERQQVRAEARLQRKTRFWRRRSSLPSLDDTGRQPESHDELNSSELHPAQSQRVGDIRSVEQTVSLLPFVISFYQRRINRSSYPPIGGGPASKGAPKQQDKKY